MVLELFLGLLIVGLLGGIWARLGAVEARLAKIEAQLRVAPPP